MVDFDRGYEVTVSLLIIIILKMNVQHEVELLIEEIKRLGSPDADGKVSVTFGILFSDDRCANIFEALVGTLRAAKRKKVVTYEGELLLQGVHDNVPIQLLKDSV
uniref:Costars domain-containing protein n=2 Tax=Magallana gigas TaxID=29159 RepID=A0A8W8NGW4_MAGGI